MLINVQTQNPKLADKIGMIPYPKAPDAPDVFVGDFQSVVIPKAVPDFALSRALVLSLFNKPDYIRMLHTTPSHNLPNLKSVATSAEFLSNPIIQRYLPDVDAMVLATSKGRSLLRETPQTPLNARAGNIFGARVLVGTLQDVVIGGVSPKQAAADATDKLAAIMKA